MSFKRDGEDSSLLGNIKKRRVAELFASDIPSDEAYFMSSGRYSCLVCKHRPVLDNITALALHRKGKKHSESHKVFIKEKEELQQLILKRQHEQYLRDRQVTLETNLKPGVLGRGFLAYPPYDSRTKKKKILPYNRKCCLQLETQNEAPKNPQLIKPYMRNFKKQKKQENGVPTKERNLDCVVNACVSSELQDRLGHSQKSSSLDRQFSDIQKPKESEAFVHAHRFRRQKKVTRQPVVPEISEEKKRKTENFIRLKSSGWNLNSDGRWVKSNDAEFDSDEEEPSIPLL